MSRLLNALRTVLLEDPRILGEIPRAEMVRICELLEVNHLEPLAYSRLRETGGEDGVPADRLSSWKIAYVLSKGRALAYAEALREILGIAAGLRLPVRLLRGTQLAFFQYPAPELRPVHQLEIQAPPESAVELHFALKLHRYVEEESLLPHEAARRPSLPRLAKEGVQVSVYKRSALHIRRAPWDPFTDSARDLFQPRLLSAEPLVVLLAHDLAARSYCHSLADLHDLHFVMERSSPNLDRVLHLATETGMSLEVYLALRLARDVLRTPVDERVLHDLALHGAWDAAKRELLEKLSRAAIGQYPASWRLSRFTTKLLGVTRQSVRALSGTEG